MKRTITLFTASLLILVMANPSGAQNSASDDAFVGVKPSPVTNSVIQMPKTGTYFTDGKSVLLYDNGTIVNAPGGSGDPDTSRLQSASLGMNTLGAGHQLANRNRVAEDLIVPDALWNIDSIVFFAYQTGSTLTSTINNYNLRVWTNVPDSSGSTVVWGDTNTNRLSRTAWSNIYRNSESLPTDLTRPVMRNVVATPGLSLATGTYYLDWQAGGTLASGPWAPPISITGLTTTGNGRQRTAAVWAKLLDTGTATPLGLPFLVYGTISGSGIGEGANIAYVEVFPNPSSDIFNICMHDVIQSMQVFDHTGRIIFSDKPYTSKFNLQVSDWAQGIYTLRIQSVSGVSYAKIVVN